MYGVSKKVCLVAGDSFEFAAPEFVFFCLLYCSFLLCLQSGSCFIEIIYDNFGLLLQEVNMFVQSSCDLDSLVKVQVLSSAQLMQKTRLRSGNISAGRVQTTASQPLLAQQSSLLSVDDFYRDKKPSAPMHRVQSCASLCDPVQRHGTQALEMRALEKKGLSCRLVCVTQSAVVLFKVA